MMHCTQHAAAHHQTCLSKSVVGSVQPDFKAPKRYKYLCVACNQANPCLACCAFCGATAFFPCLRNVGGKCCDPLVYENRTDIWCDLLPFLDCTSCKACWLWADQMGCASAYSQREEENMPPPLKGAVPVAPRSQQIVRL